MVTDKLADQQICDDHRGGTIRRAYYCLSAFQPAQSGCDRETTIVLGRSRLLLVAGIKCPSACHTSGPKCVIRFRAGQRTVTALASRRPTSYPGFCHGPVRFTIGRNVMRNPACRAGPPRTGQSDAKTSFRVSAASAALVLAEGLCSASFPINDDGHNSYVKLNSIPFSLIDRIEVLKDGASSTYGADPIGGVVNLILKEHVTGVVGTVEAGAAQNGDAEHQRGPDRRLRRLRKPGLQRIYRQSCPGLSRRSSSHPGNVRRRFYRDLLHHRRGSRGCSLERARPQQTRHRTDAQKGAALDAMEML